MSNVVGEWVCEIDLERSGQHHMDRDEQLALERREDPTLPPVLRLYTWQPPAVSLGYQQDARSIDHEACAARGTDIVRRPTGGRAVLHHSELTYAVVMQEPAGMGIYAAHNVIVKALMLSLVDLGEGYQDLGITGAATDTREKFAPGSLTNAACFASTSRHEVAWKGRKVIGSAQRRFGSVVLQHGSILLCDEHLLLPELLLLSTDDKARMRAMLERETATLSDVFRRTITAEEAANSIQTHFIDHICSQIQGAALPSTSSS